MNAFFRSLGTVTVGIALAGQAWTQMTTVRVASGLQSPVGVAAPINDFERLFVIEQFSGRIEVVRNGVPNATAFLDIHTKIITSSEQGLLGLAFHPDYANNGYFYVNYTAAGNGATIIERYQCSPPSSDVALPNSGTIMLGPISQPQTNHNGGCLQFGPDGKLYIAMGDGGGANDTGTGHNATSGNGQFGGTLLGKILRIDVDIPAPHIPPNNPFVADPNVMDEIWHLGMRNPWRFSFDRGTGDMYIGDVGQGAREEIDYQAAGVGGKNYGWRCMEGLLCTGFSGCTCNSPALTLPIHDYSHSFGIAVTGGYLYRGCAMPSMHGTYFFADYGSARIWSFTFDGVNKGAVIERTSMLAPGGGLSIGNISSFGEDSYGEILIVDYSGGEVFKIVPSPFVSDCNNNKIEDGCELATGQALDINGNGIIDTCECTAPTTYCSPKFNSQGCLPTIGFTGNASATAGSGFTVRCMDALNNKSGLLFYGATGQASLPFQGGTLCVKVPIKRSVGVNSGGTAPPANDCSGIFSIDMNAFALGSLGGSPSPFLQLPGTVIDCQWWGRDPGFGAPNNTQLSGGLEYQICP